MLDFLKVPNSRMIDGIKLYVDEGIMPGDFLTALFSNSLTGFFTSADWHNAALCREWAQWVYMEMPADIVGSYDKMLRHCENVKSQKRRTQNDS